MSFSPEYIDSIKKTFSIGKEDFENIPFGNRVKIITKGSHERTMEALYLSTHSKQMERFTTIVNNVLKNKHNKLEDGIQINENISINSLKDGSVQLKFKDGELFTFDSLTELKDMRPIAGNKKVIVKKINEQLQHNNIEHGLSNF